MNIISRGQWGARTTVAGGRHVAPSARRFFVVHWPGGSVVADSAQAVRNIESWQAREWPQCAPGYNFLVGQDGRIFEGCGRDVRGIHSPPRNTDGFGICVMAPLSGPPATPAALAATRALWDHLNGVCGRTLTQWWHGRDFATACPGPQLIAWVQHGMNVSGIPAPPAPPDNYQEDPNVSIRMQGNTVHVYGNGPDGTPWHWWQDTTGTGGWSWHAEPLPLARQ